MNLTKVEDLLRHNVKLEEFDLKKLMKEYYEQYQKNVIRKIGKSKYDEMIEQMPYEKDDMLALENYLKYKNVDAEKLYNEDTKRFEVRLFDCDSSNDTCELSTQIYEILWGLNKQKIQGFEECDFGPDTANSVANSLNHYVENNCKDFYELYKTCSVKKMYEIYINERGKYDNLIRNVEFTFGQLFISSGCLGNLTLVPYRFNRTRNSVTGDYWDLSLYMLKELNDIELNERLNLSGRGKVKWNKQDFNKYVNMMFLWDYIIVESNGEVRIKPLLESHEQIIDSGEWEKYKYASSEDIDKEYKRYVKIVNRIIKRRGLFIVAMLRIAKGIGCKGENLNLVFDKNDNGWNVSKIYKKIVREVFCTGEVYENYEKVFEMIKDRIKGEEEEEKIKIIIDKCEFEMEQKSIKATEIISLDDKNNELIVKCNDGKYRKFNVERMFENDIPLGMQRTWKCMIDANEFKKAYILTGDIVWPGRCEILSSDISRYLDVI